MSSQSGSAALLWQQPNTGEDGLWSGSWITGNPAEVTQDEAVLLSSQQNAAPLDVQQARISDELAARARALHQEAACRAAAAQRQAEETAPQRMHKKPAGLVTRKRPAGVALPTAPSQDSLVDEQPQAAPKVMPRPAGARSHPSVGVVRKTFAGSPPPANECFKAAWTVTKDRWFVWREESGNKDPVVACQRDCWSSVKSQLTTAGLAEQLGEDCQCWATCAAELVETWCQEHA